jgi:hypothetical protein
MASPGVFSCSNAFQGTKRAQNPLSPFDHKGQFAVSRHPHNLKVVGSNPTPATSSKARPSGRVFVSRACVWLGRLNAVPGVVLISPDLCSCSGLRPHFPQISGPEVDPVNGLIGLCGLLTLAIVDRSAKRHRLRIFDRMHSPAFLAGTPRAPTGARRIRRDFRNAVSLLFLQQGPF